MGGGLSGGLSRLAKSGPAYRGTSKRAACPNGISSSGGRPEPARHSVAQPSAEPKKSGQHGQSSAGPCMPSQSAGAAAPAASAVDAPARNCSASRAIRNTWNEGRRLMPEIIRPAGECCQRGKAGRASGGLQPLHRPTPARRGGPGSTVWAGNCKGNSTRRQARNRTTMRVSAVHAVPSPASIASSLLSVAGVLIHQIHRLQKIPLDAPPVALDGSNSHAERRLGTDNTQPGEIKALDDLLGC